MTSGMVPETDNVNWKDTDTILVENIIDLLHTPFQEEIAKQMLKAFEPLQTLEKNAINGITMFFIHLLLELATLICFTIFIPKIQTIKQWRFKGTCTHLALKSIALHLMVTVHFDQL